MSAQPAPTPVFSVVIPTFNRPNMLQRAVRSVLDQTFQDFEVIVVDDGSTVDYAAARRVLTDHRVRWLRQTENGGAGHARNVGAASARGRYIALLDDDDEYLPSFLERTHQTLEGTDDEVGLSWCSIRRMTAGPTPGQASAEASESRFEPSYPSRRVLFEQLMSIGTGFGVTFKATCFKQVGGFDRSFRTVEDTDLFFRVLGAGFLPRAIPEISVVVHDHPFNRLTGTASHVQRIEECRRLLHNHRAFLDRYPSLGRQLRYRVSTLREELEGRGTASAPLNNDQSESAERLDADVDQWAVADPDRPALIVGDTHWTYADVAREKARIAHALRGLPLGEAPQLVGVLAPKEPEAYAALLGVMASGHIYTPLNPTLPARRLLAILAEAKLDVLIAGAGAIEPLAAILAGCQRPMTVLLLGCAQLPEALQPWAETHRFAMSPAAVPSSPIQPLKAPREPSLAYLLFTSGSTGRPKGVAVSHASALACVEATVTAVGLTEGQRFSQFSELSFDVSIAEMFCCWRTGSCLYVPSFKDVMLPAAFVTRNALTVWSSVPTLAANMKALGALEAGTLPSLRWSLFSGEALPSDLAASWQRAAPASRVVNLYGPTEATIFASCHCHDAENDQGHAIVPLGHPLAGFESLVVDPETLEEVESTDGIGELWLHGPQVVDGYWRAPEPTARAFVRRATDGKTWYRTGDLVRFDPSAGLLFHGRRDRQIKLRGYRIELHEIEHELRRLASTDLVAVVAVSATDGRNEDLVAFCRRGTWNESELRDACRRHLPAYMIPSRIVGLDHLPIHPSGKIDYHQLAGSLEPRRPTDDEAREAPP